MTGVKSKGSIFPDEEYQAHLANSNVMIQRCRNTGEYFFYPRVVAPGSGSTDLEWVKASGKGEVYATTVVRAKPPMPSYNVALVELEEGPRMMSRVEGLLPEEVAIGMQVAARIEEEDGFYFLVFDPVAGE